jgi:hypothetical protein
VDGRDGRANSFWLWLACLRLRFTPKFNIRSDRCGLGFLALFETKVETTRDRNSSAPMLCAAFR